MTWNGHRAALSLTFDDGLPCQQKWALPLLEKYQIPSTFFLIQNSPFETGPFPVDVWKRSLEFGHEIGSHSVNHQKAGTLLPHQAFDEGINSKSFLEKTFGVRVDSFCYPYTDAPGFMQTATQKAGYTQARGGRIARPEKLIGRNEKINHFNLPSLHISNAEILTGHLFKEIDRCIEKQSWLILMFHSVGPCKSCTWDNISLESFESFLQFLCSKDPKDLWIAPFGVVAKEQRS